MCPATGLASLLTMGMSMDEEFVGPSWSGLSCGISGSLARPESWGPHTSQPALLPQSCPHPHPLEASGGLSAYLVGFLQVRHDQADLICPRHKGKGP